MQAKRDEQGRFVSPDDLPRFEITVWDIANGDIVEKLWEASKRESDEIEERYSEDEALEVQVEEKWNETA